MITAEVEYLHQSTYSTSIFYFISELQLCMTRQQLKGGIYCRREIKHAVE